MSCFVLTRLYQFSRPPFFFFFFWNASGRLNQSWHMCTWNSFIWSSSSYTKSDWARCVDLITANKNSLFYQLDPLIIFLLFLGRETSDHKQVTIFPGNDAINGPVESLVENKWTCNEEEDGWKKAFDETTHARILAGVVVRVVVAPTRRW